MKPANGMSTNAVKEITAAFVALLCGIAWFTAILYLSLTMEF